MKVKWHFIFSVPVGEFMGVGGLLLLIIYTGRCSRAGHIHTLVAPAVAALDLIVFVAAATARTAVT